MKFKIGFTIDAETLFGIMAKVLPIEELTVEELTPPPVVAPPRHNLRAQIKSLGADSLLPGPKVRKKQRTGRGPDLKSGINGVIVKAMADGQEHRAVDLAPLLQAAGFSSNSIASRLGSLRLHGVVKQVGGGRWRLTDPVLNAWKQSA